MALYETPKIAALTFLDTKHMRAGRPHPDAEIETALINQDADFVLKYIERHAEDARVTPGHFYYHEYKPGYDNHEEFMAKFGAPVPHPPTYRVRGSDTDEIEASEYQNG